MVVWGLAGGRQGWGGGETPGVTGGVPLVVRRDSLVTRFGVVIGIGIWLFVFVGLPVIR